MKTIKSLTIKSVLLMLIVCMATPMYGQRKKNTTWQIGASGMIGSNSGGGIYVQASVMEKMPVSYDFRLSLSAQETQESGSTNGGSYESEDVAATASFVSSINYHIVQQSMRAYVGAGLGLSYHHNVVWGRDSEFSPSFVPRAGIVFANRMSISADYHITKSDYSRVDLSIGFAF